MAVNRALIAAFMARPRYSNEARALFARMTVQPDAARKGLIDDLIVSLKGAGIWSKLECLYLTAAHDAQAARRNWIADAFDLSAVSSPTFTTDRGYAGDGSTSYLDTGLSHSAGAKALQNSTALGVWINAGTDSASNGAVAMGATTNGVGSTNIRPRSTANKIRGAVATATTQEDIGSVLATNRGFSALSRTASNLTTAYRNAISTGAVTTASTTRSSANIFIGGINNSGVFGGGISDRIAMAFIGGGLSDTEMADLQAATSTYLTAIGAN